MEKTTKLKKKKTLRGVWFIPRSSLATRGGLNIPPRFLPPGTSPRWCQGSDPWHLANRSNARDDPDWKKM